MAPQSALLSVFSRTGRGSNRDLLVNALLTVVLRPAVSSAVGHTAQQRAATAVFGSMMRTVLRGSPRMLLRTLLRTGTRLLRPLLSGPGSVVSAMTPVHSSISVEHWLR